MSEWFSRQALGSLPADAARRWGAREALSFQGRRWTFAELSERVDRVARGLMGLGIAPGEHVALWMVNLPEFIDAAFAVMKIGAVLVPINTRFRTEDLAYVLAQSDASTLLIAERSGPVNYLGMVRQLAPSLETARAGEVREARFPRWKRVVVAAAEPRPGMLMSMVTGARQILTETFDPPAILALMAEERPTILHGFDTHFKDLMEALDRSPRELGRVRTGICATGMSSSVPVARRARHVFGRLVSGYGMSEFGAGAALGALDSTEEQCVEASGYPAPGYELKVVDPATGREQPGGTPGEIQVRSYMTMQGYYKRPEETAKTIDPEGWVHTGDMGLIRADGHLRFLGRYKDMLKIGGENVDPMEVETFLMGHPAINLAAVVAFPDARLSEVGVAFVRLEPGEALGEAEVIDYCRDKIASFKIPRHVIFVAEFPMTGSGKIQKAKLREEALAQFTPG